MPSGLTSAYGQAAQLAGQSAGLRTQRQRQFQADQQAQEIAFKREQMAADVEAQTRSHAWEMEKMERASRLEFDKQEVAEQWDVQKMKIRSQLDFEREEKKRQQALDELDATNTQIDNYAREMGLDQTDEGRADIARMKLGIRIAAINKAPSTAQELFPKEYAQDRSAQIQKEKLQSQIDYVKQDTSLTAEEKKERIDRLTLGVGVTREPIEHPVFTPASVQKGLGMLATGTEETPLGFMKIKNTRNAYEEVATRQWGPNWRTLAPEAQNIIDQKFGSTYPVVIDTFGTSPSSVVEFEAKVADLSRTDPTMARAYYNRYVGKFK